MRVASHSVFLFLILLAGCHSTARKDPLHAWPDNRPAPGPARKPGAASQPAASSRAALPEAEASTDLLGVRSETSAGRNLLVINDELITVDDILRPIRERLEKAAAEMPSQDYYALMMRTVRDQIIAQVSERLVWREAGRDLNEEMKKRVDAVVDEMERDRINREFGGREPRYEEAIARDGRTRVQVREVLRRHLVVQQYVRDRLIPRITVSRRELMQYYEQHKSDFTRPGRVEMFLIDIPLKALLKPGETSDAAKTDAARRVARERLDEARRRLLAGEPFDVIAKEYSKGLHASAGGRWGFISEPLERYWAEPSKRALQMSAGEISPVCDTPDCVYLVKAGKVDKAETTSFEAAQPAIVDRVKNERLARLESEYLQSLLDRSTIGRMEPFVQAVIAQAPESKRLSSGAKQP